MVPLLPLRFEVMIVPEYKRTPILEARVTLQMSGVGGPCLRGFLLEGVISQP